MATKKAGAKKGGAKKGGAKKAGAKKGGAKKGATRQAAAAFPIPNLACITRCVDQYRRCVAGGTSPQVCMQRLIRCIQTCSGGGF
jgi:hypothetical protein